MAKVVQVSEKPISNIINNELDIAKAIKFQRTSLGLSRQEVADFCNISYKTLENIENGNKACRIGNIIKVASKLGVQLTIGSHVNV